MEDNHIMSIHHQSDGDVATIQKEGHKFLPFYLYSKLEVAFLLIIIYLF